MPALIFPGPVPDELLNRDIPVMFLMSADVCSILWLRRQHGHARLEGALLAGVCALYYLLPFGGSCPGVGFVLASPVKKT